jgi:hypothetical protein
VKRAVTFVVRDVERIHSVTLAVDRAEHTGEAEGRFAATGVAEMVVGPSFAAITFDHSADDFS